MKGCNEGLLWVVFRRSRQAEIDPKETLANLCFGESSLETGSFSHTTFVQPDTRSLSNYSQLICYDCATLEGYPSQRLHQGR